MMRQTRRFGCLLALALAFAAIPADPAAQSAKLLDKDTFMDMESLGDPAISPDGRQIVFARTWIDKMKDQSRSNLWIVDVDGARVRELTRGSWRDSVAVVGARLEAHRLPVRSRRHQPAARRCISTPAKWRSSPTCSAPRPASSGRPTASRSPSRRRFPTRIRSCASSCRSGRAAPNGREAPVIVDRLTWARDGTGPVEKGYSHVFVVDAIARRHAAADHRGQVQSQRSGVVAPTARRSTSPASASRTPNTCAATARSTRSISRRRQVKTLTDRKGPDTNPTPSPDGKMDRLHRLRRQGLHEPPVARST